MKTALYATVGALGLGLCLSTGVDAQTAGVQFSADTVQTGPQGQASSGKMYVGKNRTRMEMEQQGHAMVRITDEDKQVEWILFPDQHSYMERRGSPVAVKTEPRPPGDTNPCGAGMPGMQCTKLGTETISGRKVDKWEITLSHQGQTMKSTQWIDVERGVPLRQEMPGGQTMELKLIGMETLEGRKVEKWEMLASSPNQAPSKSNQWYDPELKLTVRQEAPGGYMSELKNIRVGEQPDRLFTIPAGYERLEQPASGSGQQQPGGR